MTFLFSLKGEMRRYYELYYYGMFVARIKSHSSDFSLFLKRGRSEGVILLTCVILFAAAGITGTE